MKKILRDFTFADFKQALAFVNKVAELAEAADHHPDIAISYNQVHLELWTHSTNGVTSKDLDLAAKIDSLNIGKKGS